MLGTPSGTGRDGDKNARTGRGNTSYPARRKAVKPTYDSTHSDSAELSTKGMHERQPRTQRREEANHDVLGAQAARTGPLESRQAFDEVDETCQEHPNCQVAVGSLGLVNADVVGANVETSIAPLETSASHATARARSNARLSSDIRILANMLETQQWKSGQDMVALRKAQKALAEEQQAHALVRREHTRDREILEHAKEGNEGSIEALEKALDRIEELEESEGRLRARIKTLEGDCMYHENMLHSVRQGWTKSRRRIKELKEEARKDAIKMQDLKAKSEDYWRYSVQYKEEYDILEGETESLRYTAERAAGERDFYQSGMTQLGQLIDDRDSQLEEYRRQLTLLGWKEPPREDHQPPESATKSDFSEHQSFTMEIPKAAHASPTAAGTWETSTPEDSDTCPFIPRKRGRPAHDSIPVPADDGVEEPPDPPFQTDRNHAEVYRPTTFPFWRPSPCFGRRSPPIVVRSPSPVPEVNGEKDPMLEIQRERIRSGWVHWDADRRWARKSGTDRDIRTVNRANAGLSGTTWAAKYLRARRKPINARYTPELVKIQDLPLYFDKQRHEWNIGKQTIFEGLKLDWKDPMGLHPHDLRGRHVAMETSWTSDYEERTLLRAEYNCNQTCRKRTATQSKSDTAAAKRAQRNKAARDAETNIAEEEDESEGCDTLAAKPKPKRGREKRCGFQLFVRTRSANLTQIEINLTTLADHSCLVYTDKAHAEPDADIESSPSRWLRNFVYNKVLQCEEEVFAADDCWEAVEKEWYYRKLKMEAEHRIPDLEGWNALCRQAVITANARKAEGLAVEMAVKPPWKHSGDTDSE